MKKIGWGILGAARVNERLMPAIVQSELGELISIGSRRPSASKECLLKHLPEYEDKVSCFDGKNTTKWSWYAEIKSVPHFKCISPKQIEMMIATKNNGFGNGIYVNIPRVRQPIELFVVFRALGVMSDKDICKYIVLDIENSENTDILRFLQASVIDAKNCMSKEDAILHINSYVAYTPLNMDKEMGARKKHEFTMDVLNNDLFPHCKTLKQKLYLLG